MTHPSIEDVQSTVIAEFRALPDWQARYRRIIDLGRQLPELPEAHRTDRNRVKGCQSQVWLHAELDDEQRIVLHGDSDSTLVKGLVALVIRVFAHQPPSDVATAPVGFLDELGLADNLSQTRASGLSSMLNQVRAYGVAFDALLRMRNA